MLSISSDYIRVSCIIRKEGFQLYYEPYSRTRNNALGLSPIVAFASCILAVEFLAYVQASDLRGVPGGSTWGEYQLPQNPEVGVLVAPGPDTEKVIEFLQRIMKHESSNQGVFRNIRAKGRVSLVRKNVAPKDRTKVDPHGLAPDWCEFSFLKYGTKQRYEQEYIYYGGDGQRHKNPIYRLADDQAFYRLNGNGLDIENLTAENGSWAMDTVNFSIYELVDDGRGLEPLATTLQHLIDRLNGKEDYFKRKNRFLRCYEDQGLLVVDNVCGPNTPVSKLGSRYTFWVDPTKGYRVIASKSQVGAPGRALFSTTESKNVFKEYAPGIFFISAGECILGHFSEPKNRTERTDWTRCNLEINEVAFGDLDFDSTIFSADSLPIPNGCPVADYRKDPPTRFIFGKSPLSEQILLQSIDGVTRDKAFSWREYLVIANLGLLIAIAGLIWRRRRAQVS